MSKKTEHTPTTSGSLNRDKMKDQVDMIITTVMTQERNTGKERLLVAICGITVHKTLTEKSESKSERALLPSLFARTRNLFQCY